MARAEVVAILRRAGLPQLVQAAERELGDPVDRTELARWATRHGLTMDTLVSRMGGSS
jgi:hypothetical protein